MSSNSFDTNSAFADAVQRARQIAAKIHSGVDTTGTKRPLEEQANYGLPDSKKMATMDEKSAIAQQLANFQAQRSLGTVPSAIMVEEWRVPDKMVGLIIGRGGEQITRLQAESGCKVQMAADSGGLPDRICTLTGNKLAIDKAKEIINGIINRGGPPPPNLESLSDGQSVIELFIPGAKVGLVIGKGGETIKNLQERAGVKMVLIQDGPQQSSQEKPLRISGNPDKCEFAKQLVMDLITEKELENLTRGGADNTNEYGSSAGGQKSGNAFEILVPKPAVGVVIGKGGDMIKKIQQDSGARVQFLNVKEDSPEDKICIISGSPEQMQAASAFINDLIQSVLVRDQQGNKGRGKGRPDGQPGGPNKNRVDMPEVHFAIPANKCGLIIGKGGDTIKNINQTSGAFVSLSALPAPSEQEKIFIIKGQINQIEHAKELINERMSCEGTVVQSKNMQNTSQQFPTQQQQQPQFPQTSGTSQPFIPQGWGNAYQAWQGQAAPATDPNAAWAAYYSQMYGQQQQQMQNAGVQPPPPTTEQQAVAVPTAAAGGTPDYSAAWAEYYRSMGMFREAELIENQARATPQQPAAPAMPTAAQPAPTPTPAAVPTAPFPAVQAQWPGAAIPFQQPFAPGQPQQPFAGFNFPGFPQPPNFPAAGAQ